MDEQDGCEAYRLSKLEQTLSLSYMNWAHCPSISIPKRIPTDSLRTHDAGYTLSFPLAHHTVEWTHHSLWTSSTHQRIWELGYKIVMSNWGKREGNPNALEVLFHPLLSPTMIPSLWIFNTASSNAWEAFYSSLVVSEKMQRSLGICTLAAAARGVCRTVNEADLDSRWRCRRDADSVRTYSYG